jgi:hypothetical protein
MDQDSLHLVDPEDAAEPTDLPPAPPGTVHCQECTILIGPGYLEREPFRHPQGQGVVCWPCFQSLERRAQRGEPDPPQRAWDPR